MLNHSLRTPRQLHAVVSGSKCAFTHYIPDIVITDWAVPIDGLELMQMIRQPGANANPYVAIIMLTHSEKKRVTAARDARVTEFLC